jgi:transcription elongation factor GreA
VKTAYLTAEGKAKLEAELNYLRNVRRREVAERIHAAKEFSDTVDNAEFEEAKNEQAFVEGRIMQLEQLLANAVIIDEAAVDHEVVRLGSHVVVRYEDGEEERFSIVGSAEARPAEGRISNESPVGRALLGRRPGDTVEAQAPSGTVRLTIVRIE